MNKAPTHVLGEFSKEQFLAEYWQQKPLLIENAWSDFKSPISAEELAGLACEENVSARLVQQNGKKWNVRHSPFVETDFTTLPTSHWTLLVSDVEKHLPELYYLLAPFRFIPDWRIDDLMMSYAADQGSVGPHCDQYDVFLLQAQGQRRWQINADTAIADDILPDHELRLLRHFEAEQEWLLQAGDMLYLPPGIAHYGIAVGACMTFSIGFRAPSRQEMLTDFCDYLIQCQTKDDRLRDCTLSADSNPGQIDEKTLAQISTLLRRAMHFTDADVANWFGRFISSAKTDILPEVDNQSPATTTQTELVSNIRQYKYWQRNPAATFAYIEQDDDHLQLFINGQQQCLHGACVLFAKLLCAQITYSADELHSAAQQPETQSLLAYCLAHDYLLPVEE